MLLVLALASAVPPAEEPIMARMARTDLVEVSEIMIAGMDGDHDGRVSRAEWRRVMTSPARGLPIRMSFDASPEEAFLDMDRNADGLLSAEEFARPMLASFDCFDADHDGLVQPAEDAAGRIRCTASLTPQTPAPTLAPAPAP